MEENHHWAGDGDIKDTIRGTSFNVKLPKFISDLLESDSGSLQHRLPPSYRSIEDNSHRKYYILSDMDWQDLINQ
jgi:hypothetical protein